MIVGISLKIPTCFHTKKKEKKKRFVLCRKQSILVSKEQVQNCNFLLYTWWTLAPQNKNINVNDAVWFFGEDSSKPYVYNFKHDPRKLSINI